MEERALYRAILAAPHEDAPRLVYADWLDENADQFPRAVAGAERARAAFIRAQCERARLAPAGWRAGAPPAEPATRERRLLFHHGHKWRRAFPAAMASAPFDRGFLRPFRSLTPQWFLGPALAGTYQPFPPLPGDSPARRYITDEDGPFAAAPLWDVHLYAPGWLNDPLSDSGQYGPLLAEIAQSPALARVGWLKLSFFRTPVLDFLRTGNFANVETLVLNSGPFPEVLDAVAENESFRNLRYVEFGADRWAWAPGYVALLRFFTLETRVRAANARHVPHGEMRAVLGGILQTTPIPVPDPPAPEPVSVPVESPTWAPAPDPPRSAAPIWVVVYLIGVCLYFAQCSGPQSESTPTVPTFEPLRFHDYKSFEYKIPGVKSPTLGADPLFGPHPPGPPVAPAPREVMRPTDPARE